MRWLVFLVTSMVISLGAGCGSSGGGDPDAGHDAGGEELECDPREMVLEGVLDGQEVAWRYPLGDHYLADQPVGGTWYLILYPDEGGRVRLEWPDSLAAGESGQASGTVSLGSVGGPSMGNCQTDGFVSEVTPVLGGVKYVLRRLRDEPYCENLEKSGELLGCAAFD